ncbi:MAG TPA: ASKHA domain-containing protein [Bacillota bacterium]|nr:ASKHA domain-containing protein [Bacillota bacterium]
MNVLIEYCGTVRSIKINHSIKLSEAIRAADLEFSMPCAGKGKCGKCRVRARGALSEITREEKEMLGNDAGDDIRLACMCYAVSDAYINIDYEKGSVETDEYIRHFTLDPSTGFGISVDIGTTTLVAYLFDLNNGNKLGFVSALNPQGICGGDVISRIEASLSGHTDELRELITNVLNEMFTKLCCDAKLCLSDIKKCIITGNTAMMYFLTGRDPRSISCAPFISEFLFGENIAPEMLGLPDSTEIYLTKCVSAYIGGDITSAATAVRLTENESPVIITDIGTNGESMAYDGENIYCASAAAGPCFEGVGLSCGMMAKPGAVCKVWLEDNKVKFETVSGAKAVGFCGSGIIDAVSVMLKTHVIDENGTFETDEKSFTLPGTDIYITQEDVRNIQLAKSAICSSIETIMNAMGIDSFKHAYLAGGFGNNIDPATAFEIGLLPKHFTDDIIRAGNAAGCGASYILRSQSEKDYSISIAGSAHTLELPTNPFFAERFIENMSFDN